VQLKAAYLISDHCYDTDIIYLKQRHTTVKSMNGGGNRKLLIMNKWPMTQILYILSNGILQSSRWMVGAIQNYWLWIS